LGHSLIGEYIGVKSGHGLNNALLRALLKQQDCWEFISFEDEALAPISYSKPVSAV
jgi:UDP-3-O-[3-hydroxymyristoyl] N-acetylglucosamine deacetylase